MFKNKPTILIIDDGLSVRISFTTAFEGDYDLIRNLALKNEGLRHENTCF